MNLLYRSISACLAAALAPVPAFAQFDSWNVSLMSQLTLADFGIEHTSANDCWGYISPSGREYAIIGLSHGVGFVEITDPNAPVIVDVIAHEMDFLGDVKTYRHYAYSGLGTHSEISIIDLEEIDSGVVTVVNTIDQGMHNIAIDDSSGILYAVDISAINAYDLADPVNPVHLGRASRAHDIQAITFPDGPFAGTPIALTCGSAGLTILDVSDINHPITIGQSAYPNMSYPHQGWLTPDRAFFYLDDEVPCDQPTTVFDVRDLSNPIYLGQFERGGDSPAHNLYVTQEFIFEANYTEGFQIWDRWWDPVAPRYVGYFDTSSNFEGCLIRGAWTAYPYFPSGTVIVSDIENGLFVLDPSQAMDRCLADANGDSLVNTLDFIAYLNAYNDALPLADYNRDGTINTQDFIIFLNAFNKGC